jgi:hypothetical protein
LPTKDVIDAIAASYAEALAEAVRSRSVAKTAQQSVDEIHLSYPFHPSVKHVVALFKENEAYRQTRGLMQFVSKMLKSVWQRPTNNVHLIGCQHLDLNVPDVREEVTRISALQGAIATDIAAGGQAHAELIDAHAGNDAASHAAALLLTASLSESVEAVKGLNERDLLECLISPGRVALEFQDAFAALRRDAWYLHRKENDAWYFANIENLGRRVQRRAEGAPQPKVDAEMKRRLEEIFQPERRKAYERVLALPSWRRSTSRDPGSASCSAPTARTCPKTLRASTNQSSRRTTSALSPVMARISRASRRSRGGSGRPCECARKPAATGRRMPPSSRTWAARLRRISTARS